jgi:hypothetical protein
MTACPMAVEILDIWPLFLYLVLNQVALSATEEPAQLTILPVGDRIACCRASPVLSSISELLFDAQLRKCLRRRTR